MNNRTMITNIGTINLAELDLLEDCLEVFIPIVALSENLKTTIEENVQRAKEQFYSYYLSWKNIEWCDLGVNMIYQSLHIIIKENFVEYELCFDFEDKKNDLITTGFTLEVNLSEHETELKKLVLKALIDKFF